MTGRFDGHRPADGVDTAGVPWAGRTLQPTGFEGDDGGADPALAAVLIEWRAERVAPGQAAKPAAGSDGDPVSDLEAVSDLEERLVAAVAAARLLVPVVAVPGEVDETTGLARDVSSDMASVTLTAPDGTRALPVFSSHESLVSWNPEARPVPVTAQRAALAAVQEGCQELVLDLPARSQPPADQEGDTPGPGAAAPYPLRGSMVWALAMGRPWTPPHRDEQVRAALAAAVREESAISAIGAGPGPRGALQIQLTLTPGLTAQQVQHLVTRIGERVAADGEVRARIDALSFRLSS